jgi:hypothetical protein
MFFVPMCGGWGMPGAPGGGRPPPWRPRLLPGRYGDGPRKRPRLQLAGDDDEHDDDDDEVSNAQTRRRHRRADERFHLLQARVDELVAQGERHAELFENHAKLMLDITEGVSASKGGLRGFEGYIRSGAWFF